jgi:hypothetical protein
MEAQRPFGSFCLLQFPNSLVVLQKQERLLPLAIVSLPFSHRWILEP